MTVESNAIRLNIGAGDTVIPGFTPIDRKFGKEAYPLDYSDNTVAEIRASHVLEHFPYEQIGDVLADWVRVLRPGGILKIAVPDFGALARAYVNDDPMPYQAYVMGGHQDGNDYHQAIMDREGLEVMFYQAGLERLRTWKTEEGVVDCSLYPWSLNLMGYKPTANHDRLDNVGHVLAAPRFSPTLQFRGMLETVHIGAAPNIIQGCFWSQQLSEGMEDHLAAGKEYVLTSDYDSVYTKADVLELYRILRSFDHIDAVCAYQAKRGENKVLFSTPEERKGGPINMSGLTMPIKTGHFGLTMFRASSLDKFKRPWMEPIPGPNGRWDGDHVDVDIEFWNRWNAAGFSLHLANRVPIGHMDEMITWPSADGTHVHQYANDYRKTGKPEGCWQ